MLTTKLTIKKLSNTELKEAQQIYCRCFNKKAQKLTLPLTSQILGFYLNNHLIGLTQIDIINNILENKKIALINSFCIDQQYQNQGYGDYFLKECLTLLKKEHIDTINMTSNSKRIYAHKLYSKNNFEIIPTNIFKKDL